VPFCAHHCGYCDFAVVTGKDHLTELYLDALAIEMSALREPQAVETIFIGGGTPTHLDERQLDRLLNVTRHWLNLAQDGELTVEANPGTLDAGKVAVLADHGVNRLSLGAQSFEPRTLATLERRHHPDDVPRAVELIRSRIPEISIDLIFGVPGQSLADWERDLRRVLSLAPDHVSTYGLTYEKGTRLWKQWQRGEVAPLDEDTELAMYSRGLDVLAEAGFEHYEISNHAMLGRRCRHNQVYWANEAYFGFGLGAARYVRGRRELNTRDMQTYLKRALSGEPATFQAEELGPPERARETVALQLRRAEGVGRRAFHLQTGFDLDALLGASLPHHIELGVIADDGEHVYLTRRGKYVADSVIRNLL
jgi:oxygen-independent coproporphyrinogen-3 oxidase